jgi:hypothetical protein
VNYFEGKDKTLSVDQVWLIRKSKSEEGFQRWHQDLPKLEGERSIVKTIVVNLGHAKEKEVQVDESPVANLGHAGQEKVEEVHGSSPSSVEHVRKTESQMTQKAPPELGLLAIDEAWKWHAKYSSLKTRETNKMFCRIICDHCSVEGCFGVMVANETLIHCYRNTQQWYDQGFVEGFVALVQHDAHIMQPRFKTKTDNIKIKMVLVSTPNEEVHEKKTTTYGDATHFVSPVYASSHFAVLYYDLAEATVTVFDGLNMDIKKWEMHIVHTL